MNLYLLTQGDSTGYDTYDSAIVAAESENSARLIHPRIEDDSETPCRWHEESKTWRYLWTFWRDEKVHTMSARGCWANGPSSVNVELVGVAIDGTEEGVICSSFNAG